MRIFFIRLAKVAIILFASLLALSAPAIWSIGNVLWYKYHPVDFDQSVWMNAGQEYHVDATYIRLQMASSLVGEDTLVGKSESEITELLGTPQNYKAIPHVTYWLSPQGLDSTWLQITYRDGIAKKVAIVGD